MTIDERMTICNMSIEGGARVGYVNPDETTFAFLRGPAVRAAGRGVRSRRRVVAADRVGRRTRRTTTASTLDAASIEPTVTWGINPGQSVGIGEPIAGDADEEALAFMGFERGRARRGHEDRRRLHRLVHQRPAVGSRGSRAGSCAGATSRRTSRRSSCPDRRRCSTAAEAQRAGRDLHEGRIRMARRRLLDVPRR